MTTDRTRTAPATFTRGTFLSAAALTLAGAGTAAMTAGTAPARAAGPAVTGNGRSRVALPSGWDHTIFTAAPDSSANGYLSSFTPLYGKGSVTRVSAAELRRADGIADFLPFGATSEDEEFTPVVSEDEDAVLDGDAVHVAFRGSKGTRQEGTVRLVRTADPKTRALILFVRGKRPTERNVPDGAHLISDSVRIASPAKLTADHVRRMLPNAVALSFAEDGPAPKATVDHIEIVDGGQHVSARIRGTSDGTRIDSTWYGTAVHGNDEKSWAYVFGKLSG